MVNSLLAELQHEANNTRKLFAAIPDDVLDYRPNDFNWSIAELAAHTAQVYHWWPLTLKEDVLDMQTYTYPRGDLSNMAAIRRTLEHHIAAAVESLEGYPEERLQEEWSMKNGEQVLMPPMPRIQVLRYFLMNHLYHHRGELIALLRVNGKPVPGLYGASYEEKQATK